MPGRSLAATASSSRAHRSGMGQVSTVCRCGRPRHPLHPGLVGVGLEGGGREVFGVVRVVEGIGSRAGSPGAGSPGRHGSDHTGVQPAGEEGAQRHVGHQLPGDGAGDQLPDPEHGVLIVVGMGGGFPGTSTGALRTPPRLMVMEWAGSSPLPRRIRRSRWYGPGRCPVLAPSGGVHPGRKAGILEESLELGAKDQRAVVGQGVKERLYTEAVPAGEELFRTPSQITKA